MFKFRNRLFSPDSSDSSETPRDPSSGPPPGTTMVEWKLEDGNTVQVPERLAELARAGENAEEIVRGANAKFRSASDIRKEAESLREELKAQKALADKGTRFERMVDTVKRAQGGDLEAIGQLRDYPELGVSEEQIRAAESQVRKGSSEGEDESEERRRISLDDLDDELRADVEETKRYKAERLGRMKEQTHKAMGDFLAEDRDIGYIMGEGRDSKIGQRAFEFAKSVLTRRAAEAYRSPSRGRDWRPGPQVFREIAAEVKEFLGDLGILGQDSDASNADGLSGRPGTFRGIPSLGGAPKSGLTRLHRTEPSKRPSSDDPDEYRKYLAERINYAAALGEDEGSPF